MTTWEYYSKRRNIDLSEFVKKNNLSYKDLCEFCLGRKVSPPSEEQYDLSAPKPKPKAKPKVKKSPIKKEVPEQKPAKPKRKYTKKTPTRAKK